MKLYEYIGHNQQIIDKIANKLGYNLVKKVGAGYYGTAYLTSDNKIFKVSYYSGDAGAAGQLIGKKCEYLADYYKVYKANDFYIIIMEKLDTENLNRKKLDEAVKNHFNFIRGKFPTSFDLYRLFFNSYFRDFVKIYKEARKYGVGVDTQNSGNFGLKNGHLAAFDLNGVRKLENLDKIKELEELHDEIVKNRIHGFGK